MMALSILKGYLHNLQLFSTLSAAWSTVGLGLLSGYTSQALPSLEADTTHNIRISPEQIQWVSSIVPLVSIISAPLSSPLCSLIGRKRTVMLTCLPLSAGWFMVAYAQNAEMILAGRGLGAAMAAISIPASYTYVAEISSVRTRGLLGSIMSIGFTFGLVISYSLGSVLPWNSLALVPSTIPLVQFVVLSVANRSPRWLISRKMMDEAKDSLFFFRGDFEKQVECELKDLEHQMTVAQQDKYATRLKMMIMSPGNRKAIGICLGLFFFTVTSGYAVVNHHTKTILENAKINFDSNIATIVIGCCQMGANIISALVVDKAGRKVLLYISSVLLCISQLLLGLYFHFQDTGADLEGYQWAPLVLLMMFVIFLPLGWGSITYILVSELVPTQIRTETSVLGSAWEQLLHFAVLRLHGTLSPTIGPQYLHWVFSACCGASIFYTYFFVPETSNKSLEEIETFFTHLRREAMDIIGDRACHDIQTHAPQVKVSFKKNPDIDVKNRN